MGESSHGRGEPTPRSQDLMARFDMAKDDLDRPPEVRAYLENLRPQILELQRKLKLQTQEEIDGLARRDDLDMREVDRLTGLIVAFRKAWKENRVSTTEMRRMGIEGFVARGKEAFEALGTMIEEEFGFNSTVERADKLCVIRAFARAAEPALAWNLYRRTEPTSSDGELDGDDLETHMWIWKSYAMQGMRPPFGADGLVDILASMSPLPANVFDRLGSDLVDILTSHGAEGVAYTVMSCIKDPLRKLKALLRINFVASSTPGLAEDIEAFSTHSSPAVRMTYWFSKGETEKAMDIFYQSMNLETDVWDAVIAGLSEAGNIRLLQQFLGQSRRKIELPVGLGKAVWSCLQRGDPDALFLMGEVERIGSLAQIDSDDAWRIVDGMLALKHPSALRLVDAFCAIETHMGSPNDTITRGYYTARAQAMARMAESLARHGLDASRVINALKFAVANAWPAVFRLDCASALIQAEAAVAIRTLKNEERRFRELDQSASHPIGREGWDEVVSDPSWDRDQQLVKLLGYGETYE